MTFLPIVDRELRVRARWPATYNGRWGAVALGLLIAIPWLLSPPGNGQKMFNWLSVLALAYCLFEGARQTSDCLSSERREGTLGLLFLTDLKGYDVVLGKIAGTSLSSVYGLVAMLPVLGLSLLMGGVTGGEFWRMIIVLLVTLFFSLSVGIFVSARSREDQKALAAAVAILLGITCGLPSLDLALSGGSIGAQGRLALASPAYACYLAFDQAYKMGGQAFWHSLPVIILISLAFLGLAFVNAGKIIEEEGVSEGLWQTIRRRFISHESATDRAGLIEANLRRRRLLSASPVLWLVSRERGLTVVIWICVGLLLLLNLWQASCLISRSYQWLSWASGLITITYFIFWFCAARLATGFFVEARQSGALELLLATPLRDRDMMAGQWLNLKRVTIAPLICLFLFGWIHFIPLMLQSNPRVEVTSGFAIQILLQGLGMWMHWLAVCWVGMWLGLSAKKPRQAPVKTFLLATVLPYVFCSGFVFMQIVPGAFRGPMPLALVGNPIGSMVVFWFLIRWAKRNMNEGIRSKLLRGISGPASGQLTFKKDFFVRR